jgi:hypothetical protein
MKTYNFTVDGKNYTFEAENYTQARAKLKELIAA